MPIYQIKVRGYLDESWQTWFEGLTLIHQADTSTTLTGDVVDQVRLFTFLNRIRDLNLTLIYVKLLET